MVTPGDTQRVKVTQVTDNGRAIEEYINYLYSLGCFSSGWLDIERAWSAQQAPGIVAHILHCINTVRESLEGA